MNTAIQQIKQHSGDVYEKNVENILDTIFFFLMIITIT